MPVDFHALVFESRRNVNPREGTELGFLVQEREMCWSCYGSGVDHESPTVACTSCKGSGFTVEERSLSMALAALNIIATENADAIWLSKKLSPDNSHASKYRGLEIFACCPPDIRPPETPYAFILKVNHKASLVEGLEFLGDVLRGVTSDFFEKYATGTQEVTWLYRELNGFLFCIKTDDQGKMIDINKISDGWDGSDFTDTSIPLHIDNRLQLMIQEAISHI